MANIITRRGALGLGAGALAAAAAARRGGGAARSRPRAPSRRACRSRTAPRCASSARPASCEPDEVIFRENTAKFAQATGVQVRVDFVGWEDIRAADRRHRQHRRRARRGDRLGRRPAHLRRQAGRADATSPSTSASKYGGWMFLGREVRQARAHQQLDRHPARRLHRPARLPHLGGEGGGLRHGRRRTTPASSASARR